VRFAEAEVPEALRFAVPRSVVPVANDTLPVGVAFPVGARNVTFSEVVPPVATVEGLAVTIRFVATTGIDTVTVTGTETEDANASEPA
jgi:hypothetical protein